MKKILSAFLAGVMMVIPFSAFAENKEPVVQSANAVVVSAKAEESNVVADRLLLESAKYDTSAFEGTPGYILKDYLSGAGHEKLNVVSGWDMDTRGGGISATENIKFTISDTETNHLVSMTKELMTHKSGKITFETAFEMMGKQESGFSYSLTGDGKVAFKLITDGNKLCVIAKDGSKKTVCEYKQDTIIPVRAILDYDTKTVELIVNSTNYGTYPFAEDASELDRITISTTKEETMTVWVRFVQLYVNYAVHENFMSTKENVAPYDWKLEGGGTLSTVVYDANQVYPDLYSFRLSDPTSVDSVKATKIFQDMNGLVGFESRFILKNKSADTKISIGNGNNKAITLKTTSTDFVTSKGDVIKKNYSTDLWYTLKIIANTDKKTADVYLNYQKVLSDVPFENNVSSLNTIVFETAIKNEMEMRIDDVFVYDAHLPVDYVSKPIPAPAENGMKVGMQMYSMWNEGNHYGWDWITSYPDRIPYLGTYAEGTPEVADWTTKWLVEHGFEFRTEIFCRAVANKNQPIKLPTRYHALYDGYLNSQYKDDIKFAVTWSTMDETTFGGFEDLKNNIIPYFAENFFNQPNYLLIDNKPVVFMVSAHKFINIMGGIEKTNEALAYWEEECKKMGFDGIIVAPDCASGEIQSYITNFGNKFAYSYGSQYNSRSVEKQMEHNNFLFSTGANVIANITMGYGRNPWSESNMGELFSEPSVVTGTMDALEERFKQESNPTNMVMLTCWDEYGEGHFFAPTRVHGFEYLNAVRDAVTSLPSRTTEELPTARAMSRMDSLYLGTRRALKILPENPSPIYYEDLVDHSKLQVLAEWDFEKMTDLGGWKPLKDVTNVRLENGALRGEATARDPGVINENINIKASDVQVARIITETSGGGQGQLFYRTTVEPETGTNGKRFDFSQVATPGFTEYESLPYERKKLQGNITAIRWDPKNDGFPNHTEFAVKKIQLLGYPTEEIKVENPIGITFNGLKIKSTTAPFTKDGVLYFAPNRPFYDMEYMVTYNHEKGTLTVDAGDKIGVLTIGSNIMKVNGVDVDLGAPIYYEKGNVFAPMRATLEALGVTVNWNGEANCVDLVKEDASDTYPYQTTVDTSKPSYLFETRGTEVWKIGKDISKIKAKQGSLVVDLSGADPMILAHDLSINADEYKYLKVRMKNTASATSSTLFFLHGTDKKSAWTGEKKVNFNISAQDFDFKEYIIDLSTIPNWSGKVTQLRFDVVNPSGVGSGRVYVDSIEFLKERP